MNINPIVSFLESYNAWCHNIGFHFWDIPAIILIAVIVILVVIRIVKEKTKKSGASAAADAAEAAADTVTKA